MRFFYPALSTAVGDGTWTEELREAYADRICAHLGETIDAGR